MQLLVNSFTRIGLLLVAMSLSVCSYAEAACNYESIKTEDILNCSKRSYEKSDAILNEQYKAVSDEMTAEQKTKLRGIQRDWIAYKEGYCQSVYDLVHPGEEAGIDKFGCLAKLTAARVGELVYMRTGVESDGFGQSIHLLGGMGVDADFEKVATFLGNRKRGEEDKWNRYVSGHCQFVSALFKEEVSRCLARLRYQVLSE